MKTVQKSQDLESGYAALLKSESLVQFRAVIRVNIYMDSRLQPDSHQ